MKNGRKHKDDNLSSNNPWSQSNRGDWNLANGRNFEKVIESVSNLMLKEQFRSL